MDPWRGPVFVFAVLAGALAAFWPGSAALAELWTDTHGDTYTSGFLVAAVSLWMLWRQRAELVAENLPSPWRWLALAALAGGALLWLFALRAGVQLGYLTLLPGLWWLCVLLACGWRVARAAIFPIAFIVFALPFWDHLIPILQWLTVHVVRIALRVTGVPSFFVGEIVQIPAGTFEIQGGCSGLHYFIVGLAVAVLLGELRRDRWSTRLQWVIVGGALAVISNWVRVFTIILAGHLTHMQSYLVRVSHYSYGWFIFMGALVLFFLYVRLRAPEADGVGYAGAPTVVAARMPAVWLFAVAAIAVSPTVVDFTISARLPADGVARFRVAPPALQGGWQRQSGADSDWKPVQRGADAERRWRLSRAGVVIELYTALYLEQRERKKVGGRANAPGGADVPVVAESRIAAGRWTFAAQQTEAAGQSAVVWRAIQVGDRWFVSAARAQFWYSAHALLSLHSEPSRVWILRTPCESDCVAARRRLGDFVEQNGESLWPESP